MGSHAPGAKPETDAGPRPGNDVEEPINLLGMWQVILGAAVAVLAPLAGFLGGTMAGSQDPDERVDALLAWMVGGIIVGGIGALVALVGGLRWHHNIRSHRRAEP
jgi:uncharacterized membrane protein